MEAVRLDSVANIDLPLLMWTVWVCRIPINMNSPSRVVVVVVVATSTMRQAFTACWILVVTCDNVPSTRACALGSAHLHRERL